MDNSTPALLREIKDKTGWSEPRIAEAIKTSQPTVNRILNGQEDCKGSTLRAIQELHRKIFADVTGDANQKSNRNHPTEQQVRETESAGGRSASNKEAV